jgi:multidrug efflux system outer membrane protein
MSAPTVARKALAVAAAIVLAGCATTEPVAPETEIPAAWRAPAKPGASLGERPWGEVFYAKELDALIREALANNADLRIAADRVEFARAQFGFQRSFLYPAVGAGFDYTRQRTPAGIGDSNAVNESAALALAVPTWELDLWGRVRSATESARRQLLATEDTRRAIHTSLIAQVAAGYIELLALDAQVLVSSRTAASRRESLRLIELRYRGGVASKLELNDQISLVAQADRTLAGLQRQRTQAENALSVLVGRNPGPIARERQLVDYPLPPELPAGIPSNVLLRRYDVLAAEQALYGQDANIEAARAAFFPAITLSGLLGFASPALKDLFDSGRYAWSATGSIAAPIFNAGRLQSNVEAAQAQRRIALEQYKSAVRNAFKDVEDALTAYERLTEERTALTSAVTANRERLRLSELRYRAGVSAYFEVLDSSRQLFDSELALVQATSGQYRAVVSLYQALGGGFDAASTSASDMPSGPWSAPRSGAVWWF